MQLQQSAVKNRQQFEFPNSSLLSFRQQAAVLWVEQQFAVKLTASCCNFFLFYFLFFLLFFFFT